MAITIGDIARLANVGRGTVSRVLNQRPNVDPSTRARVLEIIALLDYTPSSTARRLSLGQTQTVAVIVPFLTRPAAVEKLRGVEFALVRAGYDMVVFNVETADRRDQLFLDLPRRSRADGIIVMSLSPVPHEYDRLVRSALPVVLVDATHTRLPRVVVDDVSGGRIAARHLVDLGHQRIGFVGDSARTPMAFSSSEQRLSGVRRELRVAGIDLPSTLVGRGDHSSHLAGQAATRMLTTALPPTAIVCASDTQASGVLRAASELGIPVPEALSLTGYDDVELADHIGLTTIHQPLFEMGVRAAERLLGEIGGSPDSTLREVHPVRLVMRKTTAPPAV